MSKIIDLNVKTTELNIKIFDMNNPNFKIASSIDEVMELLVDIPLIWYNEDKSFQPEPESNLVLGIIKKATHSENDDIYGDIVLWSEIHGITDVKFKNYAVTIDSNDTLDFFIKSIMDVQVSPIFKEAQ